VRSISSSDFSAWRKYSELIKHFNLTDILGNFVDVTKMSQLRRSSETPPVRPVYPADKGSSQEILPLPYSAYAFLTLTLTEFDKRSEK
jgi:hypothetical protein